MVIPYNPIRYYVIVYNVIRYMVILYNVIRYNVTICNVRTLQRRRRDRTGEWLSVSTMPSRKTIWVGLRTCDPRIRQRKLSFQRWGKLALLLIGRSPYRRFERDAGRPWGEVVDGEHRSWKIGFSYLPVVATKTTCLYEALCLTKS